MKSFRNLFAAVVAVMAVIFIGANLFIIVSDKDDETGRPYRVEVGRIVYEIEKSGFVSPFDLAGYEYVTGVTTLNDGNAASFYDGDSDSVIRVIDGTTYRFDYRFVPQQAHSLLIVNLCLFVAALGVTGLLLLVGEKIIKPFDKLRDIPYELAKGNLTLPLKESKDRYFGRFIWGLDLLRETLEQQKTAELALQKEKKTLVLSLSHDIKTPLGIIELYAKGLEKGLYREEEKTVQAAHSIIAKCDEIKAYVNEIITASHEDFLPLDVTNGEFYLSSLVNPIKELYTEKLALLQTDFHVDDYADCLMQGDPDRAVEVLQNLMENAIKYGDGKRIALTFAEEDDCTLLSVSNTGCTLGQSELPHIFDSFWRGSNVGSHSGSGLGLYICRQLMHKMHGDIFADIRDGTMTVTIVFPQI